MEELVLYRRRFIPDERILLKNDKVVSVSDDAIVTKWDVLTKRHDFTHGVSCYYIKEGFKVSKFLDSNNNIVYWYCDIIETEREGNTYTFNDLLADVIIHNDNSVEVVDIDEIGRAMEENILPKDLIIKALYRLDKLLKIIYSGNFSNYQAPLNIDWESVNGWERK